MSVAPLPPGAAPATLIEKIWRQHRIAAIDPHTDLLFIDRIFLHERSGGRMLRGVLDHGRTLADVNLVYGTFDHIIDTDPGRTDKTRFPGGAEFIQVFRDGARQAHLPLFEIGDARQGIVHVVAPQQGIALPGLTFVCGDSHTCTVGGIGALAWGIGVTQGEHALATQTLPQRHHKMMRARLDGRLRTGVSAKDMALALIGKYGAAAGHGYAVEYDGAAVRALGVEGRMTLCNLAVEFGAWTGIVAPDDTTFDYLHGTAHAPRDGDWDRAVTAWRALPTDPGARYAREISLDCDSLAPQVTWGTSSEHVCAIDAPVGVVPAERAASSAGAIDKALSYMDLQPGRVLAGLPIDAAFIGSCTNARLDDLRAAARILKGRKVAAGIKAICVPGSTRVKRDAEAEGLHHIFLEAGFEWRESGCSLCFYNGGDSFGSARRVISSTNRNFENRQGPGVRSHLASPMTVAASAIAGQIADPRSLIA